MVKLKQMVKLLASLPVYGGIQMLRELAKHGEVMTDPAHNEGKWWAEALRLSGMSGILPELFIGRLTGPGSAQPWLYLFLQLVLQLMLVKLLKILYQVIQIKQSQDSGKLCHFLHIENGLWIYLILELSQQDLMMD